MESKRAHLVDTICLLPSGQATISPLLWLISKGNLRDLHTSWRSLSKSGSGNFNAVIILFGFPFRPQKRVSSETTRPLVSKVAICLPPRRVNALHCSLPLQQPHFPQERAHGAGYRPTPVAQQPAWAPGAVVHLCGRLGKIHMCPKKSTG